ncbi:unnamed protein product [Albugo candida]|uniref:AMP-dependent synthetase/ligase domain-containing protein n=1 Tax=Albugo candida TaxID=65357 RepID=A0A024GGP4_9STRA|nr:unnamed protein product [Albugo candida]|eukprot:CCI45715.1 unnamed protein product [Albugo candida]
MAPKYKTSNIEDEVQLRISADGFGAVEPKTLIQILQETVKRYRNDPALHVKRDGKWKVYTFGEYYEDSLRFGKSLLHLGVKRFDGVSIIGYNSPEWMIADIGTILAGCTACGIYTTSSPSACEHIVKDSGSSVVVCDGMSQLQKLIETHKNLPKLKALVVYNLSEVPEDLKCGIPIYTFEDFLQLGHEVGDDVIQQKMDAQKPGHCCTLVYTSGTTGNPKGVMLSHDNIVWTVTCVLGMVKRNLDYEITNADKIVSYLPLSHIAAQLADILLPVVSGLQVWFAQPDALKGSLVVTLKEVRPTVFLGVPRIWEKIAEKMWAVGKETTGLKKRIAEWAKSRGTQKSELGQYGNSGGVPCGFSLAHGLVLGRIKEALGLDQCILCYSAAAPISKKIIEYFASLDIPLYELFGQSEVTGPQCVGMRNIWRIGACGQTIDGSQTRVAEGTEELLFKGRNIMMGYLNSPEHTTETIDEDGWLHSGDCGKIDEDGFVTITGRIKELLITAGGENIPPIIIEDAIKEEIPLVANAMVIGDQRKFLSALLTFHVTLDDGTPTSNLDPKSLEILKELKSSAKTIDEAKACAKVKEYLDERMKRVNARATSRAQNIGKYEILPTDFSISGGELTATMKVRRKIVIEKYSELVEQIYA